VADAAPDVESKARIFISYSRKDMAFADLLEAALKARGFEPLIDRTEIYAFEDWWNRIEALISRADTVVFFGASADRLAEALQTDISWVRQHTEFGEAARRWSTAGRPGGLLLRSPVLEEAERWIASRPRGAPEPTAETQAFVAASRRGTTRRRNILRFRPPSDAHLLRSF
jgi:hypothetical protein